MGKALKLVVLLAALLVYLPLEAADVQVDLNGFRLLQIRAAVENSLGKPFNISKTNYSTVEEYKVDSDACMVFEYSNDLPNNVASIQLTGHTDKVIPFKGLRLGADLQKVNEVLGKPSQIDGIESPQVSMYSYEGTNYSVEMDADGKLYSIRIFLPKDIIQTGNEPFKSYKIFKALVIGRDIPGIIELLRPDVEIYKNGHVLYINKKYADFAASPDKDIIAAILGETDSVLAEIRESEPEGELRLIMNFGVGEVYKFYKGRILKEIVFFPYNGKHRVYEISFRE